MSSPSAYKLKIFPIAGDLCIAACEKIIETARQAIAARGRFVLALSSGHTLRQLYSLFAQPPWREQIEWLKTFIFWVDERYVQLDDPLNNAHHAAATWLRKIEMPASNAYFIHVNWQPNKAAIEYEKKLNAFFKNELPRFDLVLLELGEYGDTASFFGETTLIEPAAGVKAFFLEKEKMFCITMTVPLLNLSRHILFLATGANKSEILKTVLASHLRSSQYPAALIQPTDGELEWFADQDAASQIPLQ